MRRHLVCRVRNLPTAKADLRDALRLWFRPPPQVIRPLSIDTYFERILGTRRRR